MLTWTPKTWHGKCHFIVSFCNKMLIECLPGATVSKTDILPFILYDRNTLTSDTDKPSCFKKSDKKK